MFPGGGLQCCGSGFVECSLGVFHFTACPEIAECIETTPGDIACEPAPSQSVKVIVSGIWSWLWVVGEGNFHILRNKWDCC